MKGINLCRHYLTQLSAIELNYSAHNESPSARNITEEEATKLRFHWIQMILPIVCILGVSGNILNLVVLTKKRLSNPFKRLERAASVGLTALAFSDLLFSITVFPYTFLEKNNGADIEQNLLILYYRVYGISLINVFLMASTWLVVELALERYVVLYHPFRAKWFLSVRKTKIVIVSIFVLSFMATLPYFLHKTIIQCQGEDGEYYEIRDKWSAYSMKNDSFKFYQRWVWPFIAVFLPLTLLLFCNVRLVQGLRRVPRTRRKLRSPGQRVKEANSRITLTLIIIVFLSIVLVAPAEVLKLINPYSRWGKAGLVAAAIANVLQSINFAFNFILYCTLDAHFRKICRNIFCCWLSKRKMTRRSHLHRLTQRAPDQQRGIRTTSRLQPCLYS